MKIIEREVTHHHGHDGRVVAHHRLVVEIDGAHYGYTYKSPPWPQGVAPPHNNGYEEGAFNYCADKIGEFTAELIKQQLKETPND